MRSTPRSSPRLAQLLGVGLLLFGSTVRLLGLAQTWSSQNLPLPAPHPHATPVVSGSQWLFFKDHPSLNGSGDFSPARSIRFGGFADSLRQEGEGGADSYSSLGPAVGPNPSMGAAKQTEANRQTSPPQGLTQQRLGFSAQEDYRTSRLSAPLIDVASFDSLTKGIEATFLPFAATFEDALKGAFSPLDAVGDAPPRAPIFWVRFSLINPGKDPTTKWLVLNQPGLKYFRVYQQKQKSLAICEGGAGGDRSKSCSQTGHYNSVPFDLAPGDTISCYVQLYKRGLSLDKNGIYFLNATLHNQHTYRVFQSINKERGIILVTLGITFFTSFFFVFHYCFGGNKFFLWYAFYLLALGLFFLKHLETLLDFPILFGYFPRSLIAAELPWTGLITATYIQFVLVFFNLKHEQPAHYRIFKAFRLISFAQIISSIGLDLLFFEKNYSTPFFEFNQLLTGIFQIYGIAVLAKTRGLPYRLVFVGSIILAMTTTFTMILPYEMRKNLLGSPLGLIQIGVVAEVLLFTAALGLKMRQIELDRKAYESMRENISSDLHDEIGSTLSSIAILSEALQKNMPLGVNHQSIGLIQARTRQVMDTMSDIVWSVNPLNDAMEVVVQKMRQFSAEILEAKHIQLIFEVEEAVLKLDLPMHCRKEFYYFFKEVINNAAKHAQAEKVSVSIQQLESSIRLEIHDDGVGFDTQTAASGNGLKNLAARAQELKGKLTINTGIGWGTQIILVCPVP